MTDVREATRESFGYQWTAFGEMTAQFREDFPDKDPNYSTFNTVIRRAPDGEMQIGREPLPPMTDEMKAIIEEMK